MIKFTGFVVIKNNKFYTNQGSFTEDIMKAKDFNSKSTAEKIARKHGGYVRQFANSNYN